MDSEKRIKALALSAGGGAGSCLARWRETGDVLSLFKAWTGPSPVTLNEM